MPKKQNIKVTREQLQQVQSQLRQKGLSQRQKVNLREQSRDLNLNLARLNSKED